MTLSFLTSADTFIWAKRGLLKVSELLQGDEILGLNGAGDLSFQTVKSISKSNQQRLVRIASHRNESYVFEDQRVVKLGGASRARSLKEGVDKLELCLKPAFFSKFKDILENKPYRFSQFFSYLLGRTKKVRFEEISENRMAFLFDEWSRLKQLAHVFYQTLWERDINPHKKIYHGYSTSTRFPYELVVKCHILINLLNDADPNPHSVPIEIRQSPLECIKSYCCGIIEAFSDQAGESKSCRIITKKTQHELRRFLYNMFPIFGMCPRKTKWSYKVFIETDGDVLEKIKEGYLATRFRRFYIVKKLDHFRLKSIYRFETTGIHWSPVTDLLLLES